MSTEKHQSPPLPVGITLDRGFALLRTNPRALLVPQLVYGVLTLIVVVILGVITYFALGDVHSHLEIDRSSTVFGDSTEGYTTVADFTDGQTTTLVIAGVLFYLIYGLLILASTVTVVRAADLAIEGRERLPLKAALKDGARQTPKLFGLSVVFFLMMLVYFLVVGIVVAVFIAVQSAIGALVAIAAFVLTVWVGVRLVLWPFAHISENAGLSSYRRSWTLTKGRFWPLFGVLLLVAIVVSVVAIVVIVILALIFSAISSIGDDVGVVALIPYLLGSVLLGVVATAGYISPIVVSYRTLAGRDNADLWQAATAMGGGAPPADPAVRRWDAAEAPVAAPAPGWTPSSSTSWDGPARTGGDLRPDDAPPPSSPPADAAPPVGSQRLAGLPPSDEPSDAEKRWGRDSSDPPAS